MSTIPPGAEAPPLVLVDPLSHAGLVDPTRSVHSGADPPAPAVLSALSAGSQSVTRRKISPEFWFAECCKA